MLSGCECHTDVRSRPRIDALFSLRYHFHTSFRFDGFTLSDAIVNNCSTRIHILYSRVKRVKAFQSPCGAMFTEHN